MTISPLPGLIQTRATAVFRFPLACKISVAI
jgi:hypothetical protein